MTKICSYLWTHLHLQPDGNVYPCCMSDTSKLDKNGFLNLGSNTLLETVNSENLKQMRRDMLSEKEPEACHVCFNRERAGLLSQREQMNERFLDTVMTDIKTTNADGSIDEFEPYDIDLRFSNICNLKCRMCGLGLSSSWYEEILKDSDIDTSNYKKFIRTPTFDKVKDRLSNVVNLYWAGGEPLLEPNHYKVVNTLINNGQAKDTTMSYNTNMTTLEYKSKPVTDIWKHFKNVTVAASIDGFGDTFEYIRTNGKWETAKQNYEKLRFEFADSNIAIFPSVTVSILNIHHVIDYFAFMIENNWIDKDYEIPVNFVSNPIWFNLTNLPPQEKERLTAQMKSVQNDWEDRGVTAAVFFDNICKFMNRTMPDDWHPQLKNTVAILDNYDRSGNLDWKKSLPELAELLHGPLCDF